MASVKDDATSGGPRRARAPFACAVLVCGKCERKLDGGGFGRKGREPLRKALKAELKTGAWGRKVRIVETGCLKLCPKRRQVVASAQDMGAGRLWVAEPGASAAAVLHHVLGMARGSASVAAEGGGA